jgi:hypothetical protein
MSVLVLSCGAPAENDRDDDMSSRPAEESYDRDRAAERRREDARIEAAAERQRELGDAKITAQWARDDLQRAEQRLRQLKSDIRAEEQAARDARSSGNRISADLHQQRVEAIRDEIRELEYQLVDLRERAKVTEKEYQRLLERKN